MRRAKRVRFIDTEADPSQSRRFEASSAQSNDPKTSEFAFFKKFREDSGLKHQSKLPSRGNVQLRNSKNYGGGECSTSGTVHIRGTKDNSQISNTFFTQNARANSTELPLSPRSRRSEQGNRNLVSSSLINTNGMNDQEENLEFSPLIRTPTSSGTDDFFLDRATDSVRSDTRFMDGDIFSKKRAKLQSWVTKTMFPGSKEIPTGCDLISLLLNRLLPESYERNASEALKPRQDEDEAEYESVSIPKSGYQLKKTWKERNIVKHEEPCFMDAGASWPSSSRSNKFHGSFLLERPVTSGYPSLECADEIVLGHQHREIDPHYFSNIDYRHSWNNNSAETFVESNANSYATVGTFNPRRMTLEYESYPSSSRYYSLDNNFSAQESLDNNFSAQESFPLIADSSTQYMSNYDNRFLLEYEKMEPTSNSEASMFGNSPGNCRSSSLRTFIECDESDDEFEHSRFRRKPSDFLLGWEDNDRMQEKEISCNSPSTALMHYHHIPEISTVDTRFNPPLANNCEFIPATDSGFLYSPSDQYLLPQRSYYHEIDTHETANPSSYLLLEGNEDEHEKSSRVREICYHEPSQILELDWRNTDEEEEEDMYGKYSLY